MAVTLEQVEKLREKADVSYEEAKRTLEQTQGDLLEALILLEQQGRTRNGAKSAHYTTRPGGAETSAQEPAGKDPSPKGGRRKDAPRFRVVVVGGPKTEGRSEERPGFWGQLRELLMAALDLLRHCTVNQFEVWRNGELMTSLPVLILILLVVVAFWVSLPLLILGLFFGCKYRFTGPDLEKNKAGEVVNQVVEQVSNTVGEMVNQVKDEFAKSSGKKNK